MSETSTGVMTTNGTRRWKNLERLGYRPRDAKFLCWAGLHSGYFLERQYEAFGAGQRAQGAGSFAECVQKALARTHARAVVFDRQVTIYHLSSRRFFGALGEPDNRNRREREPVTIKQKLMGFDFVLKHPEVSFLATESEKLAYFASLGIAAPVLPAKVYAKDSGASTRRFFVEKYPLGVDQKNGEVVFAFVDAGLTTPSHFETFMARYASLFATLSRVRVVYVCDRSAPFRWSQRVFARALFRPKSEPQNPLDRFFSLRRAYELGDLESLGKDGIVELAHGRRIFVGPQFEARYATWTAETAMGEGTPRAVIENELLEESYELFGTIHEA